MTGGQSGEQDRDLPSDERDDSPNGPSPPTDLPVPPSTARPVRTPPWQVESAAPPADQPTSDRFGAAPDPRPGTPGVGATYRSAEERKRSVRRLADPWYRRFARWLIATSIVAALAIGAFALIRVVQDYLDRDQLPSAGLDTPDIEQTSFLITASSSGLKLEGTLTIDIDSGAFEFIGTPGGPNTDDWLTSPDGGIVYARQGSSDWLRLPSDDSVVASVRDAMSVLGDHKGADVILTNTLRRNFIDLVRVVDEGAGTGARTRYDITIDLDRFADRFPLQWEEFRLDAVPGARAERQHRVSLWLDVENVLVRVDDQGAGWHWERLAYSAEPFRPVRPEVGQIIVSGPDP